MDSLGAPLITAAGAFVGSLIAALVAPWLLQRSRREQDRRDAIRALVPKLVANAFACAQSGPAGQAARIEHTALHSELELHLRASEWQIERIAWRMSEGDEPSRGSMVAVFPTAVGYWLRREKTSEQARLYFEKETGVVIRPLWGAPPK